MKHHLARGGKLHIIREPDDLSHPRFDAMTGCGMRAHKFDVRPRDLREHPAFVREGWSGLWCQVCANRYVRDHREDAA